MEQLVLDIGIVPQASFSRFLADGNEAAVHALQEGVAALAQACQQPPLAPTPAPVFLWGGAGTGKSHLLEATARMLQQQGLSVGWLRRDGHAAADKQAPPDEFQPHWHAILFDDVDGFSTAQQQIAFNWFINATLPQDGLVRWVIAAGSAPPVDLPLRDDLRSRLGSGLSFELHALNDAQRLQVLTQQARERGLHLSAEVGHYLLTRYSRDLSSLSTLLARLDTHALREQRALTLPLLRQALQQNGELR